MQTVRRWIGNPYFWAVVARLAVLFFVPYNLRGDAGEYYWIGRNIAEGNGFSRCWLDPHPVTAQRPPLYPLFLAFLYTFSGPDAPGFPGGHLSMMFNILFDLGSMYLLRRWAETIGLPRAGWAPWVIALNPLLIGFCQYPNAENFGLFLFLLATLALFARREALSGFLFGLLSLTRSFFVLFPLGLAPLAMLREGPWKRRALVALMVFSFAAPAVWVARNYQVFGHFMFSQGSTVGYQSYAGVCMMNFDWWHPESVKEFLAIPTAKAMSATFCMADEQVSALDHRMRELVRQCIRERPLDAAMNVLVKQVTLYTKWGRFLPYSAVPEWAYLGLNGLMGIFWILAMVQGIRALRSGFVNRLRVAWRERRASSEVGTAYALLVLAYVTGVTIPFAVDARYLLAPTVLLMAILLCGGLRWKEFLLPFVKTQDRRATQSHSP